jgi:anti-sigma B factor antagonist
MRPLQLEAAESSTGRTVIVKLKGEFDMSVEGLFAETVTEGVVHNGHSAVVLDLSGVTFLDSSGIGALIRARHEAVARGSRFVLLRPSAAVEKVLEISGLPSHFETTLEDATILDD